jgi:hypothetical protein
MSIDLQNENGVSYLKITVNKRILIMPYGGTNHKQHSTQAGILRIVMNSAGRPLKRFLDVRPDWVNKWPNCLIVTS